MGHYLGNHFGVLDSNGQPLLAYRAPIDATELIDLANELFNGGHVDVSTVAAKTAERQLYWERESVCSPKTVVLVAGVVA